MNECVNTYTYLLTNLHTYGTLFAVLIRLKTILSKISVNSFENVHLYSSLSHFSIRQCIWRCESWWPAVFEPPCVIVSFAVSAAEGVLYLITWCR